MKQTFLAIFAIVFMTISCKGPEPVATTAEGQYFGEEFEVKTPLSVVKVMEDLKTQDTLNVQVAGIVESVCKTKGCWTNMAQSESETDKSLFVKFKDYGFFLPLDCEGQDLVLEGKAYMEETPVDELRHYAEDEGKSAEEIAAITEPAKEFKFMASGAYLKNKNVQ